MMEPIRGALAGVDFTFSCDATDLAAYARRHLAPLLLNTPAPETAVHATLCWHEGQPPRERAIPAGENVQLERIDRDLYVGPGQLRWFRVDDLRDLHLRVRLEGGKVLVDGDFYYRLGNTPWTDRLRRMRQWRRRDSFRRRRFTTLLAYLVYYPCWWWWEQRDYHPIHAAGVQTDAGVVLLAGAGGVGKSTLSAALALSPGARFLADSFVLHHGREVKAVPEPVLLDSFSRRWLGSVADELQPVKWRYGFGRSGYQLPESRRVEQGRATLLVFPRRSQQSYARRISSEEAHRRLSAADFIINDLRRYWAFAAVLEQIEPAGLMARREAQLALLTGGVPCYDIGLTPETPRAEIVQTILELLPKAPQQAVQA